MEKIKRRPLRSTELDKKKKKNKRYILYIIAALAVLLAGIYLIYKKNNIIYNSFQVNEGASWTESSYNQYMPYKNGMIKFNKDGAEAISSNGTLLWNVSYNMKDPIAEICGSYAVIADRGNKSLIIVDGSGSAKYLDLVHNISMISVSGQGITAVITDNDMMDMLYIYKPDSVNPDDTVAYGVTEVVGNGFPMDIAISPDGKKTVDTYLTVQEDNISTWVTFRNYGEVGKNYGDNLVGSYKHETIAPRTCFLNSDTALILIENGFVLYNIPENPKLITTITVEEEIWQTAYSNSMICLITKNTDEKGKQKVYCYNLEGRLLSEFYMQERYDKVMTSGGDIVFYNKASFFICDRRGRIKMQGELAKNYEHIYPFNNEDKYLLVGEGYMETLKLLNVKE